MLNLTFERVKNNSISLIVFGTFIVNSFNLVLDFQNILRQQEQIKSQLIILKTFSNKRRRNKEVKNDKMGVVVEIGTTFSVPQWTPKVQRGYNLQFKSKIFGET